MVKWILGIIGGIGFGKSVVSVMFEEFGIKVVDVDVVVREVVELGLMGLKKIIEYFGDEIFMSSSIFDCVKLRIIIFVDEFKK